MTEIDSTSLFTIIVSSIVSVLGAVGGLEFIKFTVRLFQGKNKRKLKEKGDTIDFYKRELDELQNRYKEQEQRLNDLQRQVIELNQQIAKQAATIAELSSQLQIYKCITLECPYRNKGYPKENSASAMAHYGVPQKKGKAKQNKEDKQKNEDQ
jgi:uncharacterized coiled-coil protein SlyX